MQLLQVDGPNGRRYYLDGTRISRAQVTDLKGDHDQDSFRTEVRGDVTRHYSCLRKRTAQAA